MKCLKQESGPRCPKASTWVASLGGTSCPPDLPAYVPPPVWAGGPGFPPCMSPPEPGPQRGGGARAGAAGRRWCPPSCDRPSSPETEVTGHLQSHLLRPLLSTAGEAGMACSEEGCSSWLSQGPLVSPRDGLCRHRAGVCRSQRPRPKPVPRWWGTLPGWAGGGKGRRSTLGSDSPCQMNE